MGASRKLQGEIDRVLKKVQEGVDIFDSIWNKVYDTDNANQKEKFEADLKKEIKKLQRYRDQIKSWIQSSEIKDKKALMDARKQIEREMERFKVCEKETKTKAFSKEGLGQQPKTDPREKAKSETRDWLNNIVGDLESQIDNFEAEMEGLSVKKGKTKPSRLTHLETSITRHKMHIMKLEWILRLLDNDELSPEQVNDVKEFLEDYVERNQDDFDEFSDPDELYSALQLEKVESLDDFAITSTALVKGVGSLSSSAVLGQKSSISSAMSPASSGSALQVSSAPDQTEETSQESNSDVRPRTPGKGAVLGSLPSGASLGSGVTSLTGPNPLNTGGPVPTAVLSSPSSLQRAPENPLSSTSAPIASKEEDNTIFLGRRPSPAPAEFGLGRGMGRVSTSSAASSGVSIPLISGSVGPSSSALVSDVPKRNILGVDERVASSGLSQPLASPISSRSASQPFSMSNDYSTDSNSIGDGPVIGRAFSPSLVGGVQWRPQTIAGFPNQSDSVRGRTEITPDQREKYLKRFKELPHLPGGHKQQFSTQQASSILQQLSPLTSSLPSQVGVGLGNQGPGLSVISSGPVQQSSVQQSSHPALLSVGPKDSEPDRMKVEEPRLLQTGATDDSALNSGLKQSLTSDEDLKTPYPSAGSALAAEVSQGVRDVDLSPGQPLPPSQPSSSLGVIGRRSVSDLGAIADNINVANPGVLHDHAYNLQMLEASFYKLPQSKDSERVKNYIPRKPSLTPASYPQSQHPIIDNPAFWDRLGSENITDILFFAFYYQQNSYQQYLAAKELKRQSWRYHRKYNTWFQRHEEPTVTNDDFEQGTYVYFDFHIADDLQNGWCQRIKTEFTFEYSYLEDELV
ncbi:transcription regulator NOT2/NOT3/NOT5 family protein isoform X2 [Wolffia australiana]